MRKAKAKKPGACVRPGVRLGPWPPAGEVTTIRDLGPYPLFSTVLLKSTPEMDERDRRSRVLFSYAIGGTVPGSLGSIIQATRLETNMRVPNMFVDEMMKIESVDVVVPRVAAAIYQMDPSAGPYEVSDRDMAMIASETHCSFYVGGEKPFVEALLATKPIVVLQPQDTAPALDTIFKHAGGWIARIAEFSEMALSIGRIEKFWGELAWPREFPRLGLHKYNPAVVPVVMVLNGRRSRGVN